MNISVSIGNTHDSLNSIHPSDQWAFQGVPVALWPDCFFGLPVQMVVLNGSYSLQDLPTVANVTFNYICREDVNVDHVNFQPNSNQVNLTGIYDVTGANQSLGPFRMTLNFTTAGYWNLLGLSKELNTPIVGEDQPTPPSYTAFAPGVYTIAIADEWGQAVVLHVNVLPALTSGSSTSSSHTHPSASTSTSTSLNTSLCISPGQPLGLFLRVLNDSTSLPVVGANVTAVADGYSSNCGIATVSAFTWQATDAFMTNNTEWYSLNVVNVGSYQFTVTYSGHTYNFVAQLGLSTYTCATLYLPSGATNTTISDETSCASGSV